MRYRFLGLGLLMFSVSASAAENDSSFIKKDITIEKEYTPQIKEADRISDLPSINEPDVKHKAVNYSSFGKTLTPEYEVRTLESARLRIPGEYQSKDGFLRLGFGNYVSTLGDLVLPLIQKPKYGLDFNVNHKGIFDGHDGAKHHKTDAALGFDRYFKEGNLFIDAAYSYRGFNYYGENKLEDITTYTINGKTLKGKDYFSHDAGIHSWKAAIGYQSIPDEDLLNSLSASFTYGGTMPNDGLTEHKFDTKLHYRRAVNDDHWGVGFEMQNFAFGTSNLGNGNAKEDGFTVVNFNPYYKFIRDRWNLKLGVNLNFSSAGTAFAPTADISGTIAIVKNTFFFYAGLEGDYMTNSINETVDYCHYVNLNHKIDNTYKPLDLKAGFKVKILHNLLTDLSIRYEMFKDYAFLINDTTSTGKMTNVFSPLYKDANKFSANLRVSYNLNNMLDFLLAAKYNKWSTSQAYNMPEFEFNFGTQMKFGKHMAADINFHMATGRKAWRGTTEFKKEDRNLKPIYDLNLGLYYNHTSNLSLFLKFNNVLNRHYEQWYCYEVCGFNGLIGLSYSF